MKKFVALAVLAVAAPAAAEPRKITLDEAIGLATKDSVQVDIGEEQVAAAEAARAETKTYRLPTLAIKGTLTVWDDKIQLAFDPMAPPVTLRNQVTGQVDVTVAQPLSGLFLLPRLIDANDAGIEVARADLAGTKLDLAHQAATAYLGALQAQTLKEVAETSVANIEVNLERVRALRRADVASDVDILRLEALRDQVKQQVLEAQTGADMAKNGLVLLLGLTDGTELELAPVDLTPPELRWTEEEAIAAARKRPEVRAAEARIDQADVAVDVAKADYVPNINAVLIYSHSEGQGAFGIPDSGFLGVTLEWTAWDWGRRGHKVDQARATRRMAERGRDLAVDAVAVDVRNKWLAASAKRETLTVAESGLKAAEEAHRLQNVRFNEGAATTSEVIDAETEVSRARAQATIARYQYLIAWMDLVHAVGEMP